MTLMSEKDKIILMVIALAWWALFTAMSLLAALVGGIVADILPWFLIGMVAPVVAIAVVGLIVFVRDSLFGHFKNF